MPTFADLLSPTAAAKLAAVVRPEVPTYEVLEAERVANLDRISQRYATLTESMDRQDAEDATIAANAKKLRSREPRETVGAIRKPQTKKRQPRLTCSPEELAAADAKRLPQPTEEVTVPKPAPKKHTVNLSHMSDAELGRMMRAALLTLVVDELPASMAELLGIRAEKIVDKEALRDEERAERKVDPAFLLPGFTVGTLNVPELDLRGKVLGEVAPAKSRSPYNRARYRLDIKSVLDPETTTWGILADEHKSLAVLAGDQTPAAETVTPEATTTAVTAKLDDGDKAKRTAKIAALAEVLGISKKAAAKRVKELSA